MLTNQEKTKFKARLTAARDFKAGVVAQSTRYARIGSAYAKWYDEEYAALAIHFKNGIGDLAEINAYIDKMIDEYKAAQ